MNTATIGLTDSALDFVPKQFERTIKMALSGEYLLLVSTPRRKVVLGKLKDIAEKTFTITVGFQGLFNPPPTETLSWDEVEMIAIPILQVIAHFNATYSTAKAL